jgi:WD40 repeat protein
VDQDGDRLAEVLAVSKDGHCYGVDASGRPLVGVDGSFGIVGAFSRCSPTVANLDADPEREIIVAGGDGMLRVWNHDGTPMTLPVPSAWPVNLGSTTLCSPVVGELDGDPTTGEIVLTSENNLLHAFDLRGFALPGWPKALPVDSPGFAPSPALGDINNDGYMEIFVVANATPANLTELRVFDGQSGNLLLQKNLGDRSESSPVLADVDGDGLVDIVVGGEAGLVHAWRQDGQLIDGFPLTVGDFVRSTPTLCDLDGDGDTELVLAGWDQTVYAWDLTGTWNAATALWPTYAHDVQRSGSSYTPQTPTNANEQSASVPARFAVHANVPNPFNPSTTIRFDLPQPGKVIVDIYDVRGHLVVNLLAAQRAAGQQQVTWNGRDARGRTAGSGIYWYRVQTLHESATRKRVLLR